MLLLPHPRSLTLTGGNVTLPVEGIIAISTPSLLFEAQTIQKALKISAARDWQIAAGTHYPTIALLLTIDSGAAPAQGYTLGIGAADIRVVGGDAAGVFYGVCTLKQILQQQGATLPALRIEDKPDFPARCVMLDFSRDRVPTMDTLYALVDMLASWKINELQLYMEHTFAYSQHREVWEHASPFTGQEILELDAFCRQRHIDLVPNQNSLGHMERWLKYERYRPLAECPNGFARPERGENFISPPTTLDPLNPGSLELIKGLYDELLPHFTSRLFNVGGDEPWELGQGKSKAAVAEKGGRVYLEWLLKLYEETRARGKTMQFWADIITKYPDLVAELPRDCIAMVWGYEAHEPSEEQCKVIAQSGLPFYVCPGTSTWNTIAGRTEVAMQNQMSAAEYGHKYGAIGILNTEWGDSGHWQPLSAAYLGFAYGAAVSWDYAANREIDLPGALDSFAFADSAGKMGYIAYELGEVYKLVGPPDINGQVLAYSLQIPRERMLQVAQRLEGRGAPINPETLRAAIQRIDEIIAALPQADIHNYDAAMVRAEYEQAANLLRHAAKRLLLLFGESDVTRADLLTELEQLIDQQRMNWLARHRPGGLDDSIAHFDTLLEEYRSTSA